MGRGEALTTNPLFPVAGFTLTYLGVALIAGVATGNLEFLFYIGVMVVLMGLVWIVHRQVGLFCRPHSGRSVSGA